MPDHSQILDTNIIIRFLTNDLPTQAEQIRQLFLNSSPKSLYIPDIVITEVFYVLTTQYDFDKQSVLHKMLSLINNKLFSIHRKDLWGKAIHLCIQYNKLSLTDAYLIILTNTERYDSLFTYDKVMLKAGNPKAKKPVKI